MRVYFRSRAMPSAIAAGADPGNARATNRRFPRRVDKAAVLGLLVAAALPCRGRGQDYPCDTSDTWDEREKFYCCTVHEVGCDKKVGAPITTTTKLGIIPSGVLYPQDLHEEASGKANKTFDCSGAATGQLAWTSEHSQWCCLHWGVACSAGVVTTTEVKGLYLPLPTTTTTATRITYYCKNVESQDRWSIKKRTWCCDHWGLGCATTSGAPIEAKASPAASRPAPDCLAGMRNWKWGWSANKISYCCEHGPQALQLQLRSSGNCGGKESAARRLPQPPPLPRTTSLHPESLPATFADPVHMPFRYDSSHLDFTTPPTLPVIEDATTVVTTRRPDKLFDCKVGIAHSAQWWSGQKRQWCCTHEHLGCLHSSSTATSSTTSSTTMTSTTTTPGETTTSTSTSTDPYDCASGVTDWETAWTEKKKNWCCTHRLLCPKYEPPTAGAYNCAADAMRWKEAWSEPKKNWCCKNHDVGCIWDCHTGLASARRSWTDQKKTWCCAELGVGCRFDCKMGPAKGQYWPAEEKRWCCEQRNLGCDLTTNTTTTSRTSTETHTSTKSVAPTSTSTKPATTRSSFQDTPAIKANDELDAEIGSIPNEEIPAHFKRYDSINCLSGVRGGPSLPNSERLQGDALLQACQRQCLVVEQCQGIVTNNFESSEGQKENQCWLQTEHIDRNKCEVNPHFDLWLKVDGEARFNCTMNTQMDWSVEEYEWCCEQEGVGCLKQSDLAAKFEEQQQQEEAQSYTRKAWIAAFGGLAMGAAALAVFLVAFRSHQLPYQFLHRSGAPSDSQLGRSLRTRSRKPKGASDRRLLIASEDDEATGVSRDSLDIMAGEESHHRDHAAEKASPAYAYIFADGKRVTLM